MATELNVTHTQNMQAQDTHHSVALLCEREGGGSTQTPGQLTHLARDAVYLARDPTALRAILTLQTHMRASI